MNGWSLTYDSFEPEQEGLREALCTLGNGAFASRGAAPESRADGVHYPGTYVAGCYDRLTTRLGDHDITNEDLVNVPDWLPLTFRIEADAWFSLDSVEILDYRQELDLRRGVLIRIVRFRDRAGRTTHVTQRRIVSMRDPHVAALETTFLAEDWSGRLTVRSGLDGGVTNAGVERYRSLRSDHLREPELTSIDEETIGLSTETQTSRIRVALAARTRLTGEAVAAPHRRVVREERAIAHELDVDVAEGQRVTLEKVVALYTSRDHAMSEPSAAAAMWVVRAPGFEELLARHVLAWDQLWQRFDIRIDGPQRPQMILRLHIFHLLATVSENSLDLDVGVPARGLHGEAYRGHIFWDELFILPFINVHLPVLSRALLGYRYRRLPAARWAASEAGYAGAMYPWQSGSDGTETSQTWHLNPRSGRWLPDHSHLQRHIGIAIAYNVWLHYEATGDIAFLRFRGGPMFLEIARFLASLASYDKALDRYRIRGVMGPDEYHEAYPDAAEPGLDDNAYTNVMTAWVLQRGVAMLDLLPEHYREEVCAELGLTRAELEHWEDISRRMYVPFHDDRIISQFAGYADLEELDWMAYRERYGDIHRLDRILEAEGDSPDRYQASKQADVLMLFYLLSTDELADQLGRLGYDFDPESDPPAIIDHYLGRTSNGSTLSRLVSSWVLARSDRKRSWELFVDALHSDVEDIQGGTTAEGIHLGAMAGTVDLVQRCYGGIETRDGVLWFDPALPDEIRGLEFSLHYRGHRLDVAMDHARLRVHSRPGVAAPIRVGLAGEVVDMSQGQTHEASVTEART